MRVAVKSMSGVFIHSTTPRKARLLLKEKKAVIESKEPFTIRLLFSASECGLKDSFLQQNKSDLASGRDKTMCENELSTCVQTKSKVHVIYGARHSGKSEILYDILNGKVILGLKSYLVSYNTGLDKKKLDSEKIFVSCKFEENCKDPDSLAKYYINECKVNNINVLAIDDIDFMFNVNDEYTNEEYFRAVAKECKKNNIDLCYVTHNTERDPYFYLDENSEREEAFYNSPHHIYERFSDVLTVIK